jgi:hypothetical protein
LSFVVAFLQIPQVPPPLHHLQLLQAVHGLLPVHRATTGLTGLSVRIRKLPKAMLKASKVITMRMGEFF